ncbi:MAG: hypothetical protein ACXW16_09250 [Burkholderiaceae bacterium]
MHSFRIDSQFDPADVDVAAIDRGLHAYIQRNVDLAAIHRFACYARDIEEKLVGGALARWWVPRTSGNRYGLTKQGAVVGLALR